LGGISEIEIHQRENRFLLIEIVRRRGRARKHERLTSIKRRQAEITGGGGELEKRTQATQAG